MTLSTVIFSLKVILSAVRRFAEDEESNAPRARACGVAVMLLSNALKVLEEAKALEGAR